MDPDIPVRLVSKERINVWQMRREADRLGPPKPQTADADTDAPDEDKGEDGGEEAAAKDGKTPEDGTKTAEADEPKEEELPPLEQPDENERPKEDPQLDTALLLMRVTLLGEQHPTLAVAPTDTVKEPVQP